MPDIDTTDVSRKEKANAIISVARYNPKLTIGIIGISIFAAILEGIGLSFIVPIIELVQSGGDGASQSSGLAGAFATTYQFLNIPLTLGTAVAGVGLVMTVRYTSSFFVAWFREALRTYYIRDLQTRAFGSALDARVSYFDEEGSDDILNAIVTQTFYAGRVIQRGIRLIEQSFLTLAYVLIAFAVSPMLTIITGIILGGVTFLLRSIVEPGYDIGDEVADANERRQEAAQAGTQGIRDIRIFGVADELYSDFLGAVKQYTRSRIILRRNEAAIQNFYNLSVSVSVFVLIYLSLTFADLALGSLGLFLFAMFRLGPRVSTANQLFYQVENDLPHLVRTEGFIEELGRHEEPNESSKTAPESVETFTFDDVWFSYNDEEDVLRGIDFEVDKGEFVAFVGQSGAGKSTIVSLLSRMYEPTDGWIRANSTPIDEMDIDDWREHIAVVRQDPFIFGDTLKYNLTIADREASQEEIERVCEIARVDEFLDDLPNGYETLLGDQGVRLSGGQKQRVALARALLEDADLLILDEATSDLDSNLEKEVQNAIETMDREYIIVTIAHRLSTVKNADRIYTMENGEISEAGEHEELVSNEGKYAELYAIQARD
ncbi:ABC transporter ATP-binding protein [Halococcus sp. PRR34]|uniref:ABC transporter ATP-binding protein n=1 Tax=Halococcus sp. PRR34 TaxID=3020830 RepID=UPI0023606FD3|nr:ABC transporter ATP-binding protein [Halococcus sp. PRR34]